ncbi:MAG: DUF4129 domain-containing protein [Anaerolineae bacterium]
MIESAARFARIALLIVLLGLFAGGGWLFGQSPVRAQPEPIAEAEFWRRMEQTLLLLSGESPAATRDALSTLWADVEAVQVANAVIAVDTRWIIDGLPSGDLTPENSATVRLYVQALVNWAHQISPSADSDVSLQTLHDVLNDSRFQYDEAQSLPTPVTPLTITVPDAQSSTAGTLQGFAWIALAAVAVIAIVLIARTLSVQPVALPSEEGEDEPRTSDEAHGRAESFENQLDYRQAVRYRFLALLLLLDERGILQYDPTQTNREHLRQLATQPQLQQLLRSIVNTFDSVWYGYMSLSAVEYQQFTAQVAHLQSTAQRVPAS